MTRILCGFGRLGVIVLVGSACEQNPSALSTPVATTTATTTNAKPQLAPPSAPQDSGSLAGTVVETMDASTYTYARIDTGHGDVWVAGPQTKLAVGTKVGSMPGQLMNGFHSSTLNRTFDAIYFVNAYAITGAAPSAPTAPAMAATAPAPAPAPGGDAGDLAGTVVATMDSGGYTYAQVDHAGQKIWVAGPQTKLAVGTKLGAMSGQLMAGFRSNTLNRTFDQIYFVSALPVAP